MDYDLRHAYEKRLDKDFDTKSLPVGTVLVFINKDLNNVRIKGRHGLFCRKFEGQRTINYETRKRILEMVGEFFNLKLHIPDDVYKRAFAEEIDGKGTKHNGVKGKVRLVKN